jgi:hypothetical protein
VFAELVAVTLVFTVKFPAPARMLIVAVELLIVRVPTVTSLFTVVLPAAVKVALSEAVQATPLVPFHQVLPPVQLPFPPAVTLPAELQVTLAARRFSEASRKPAQKSASTPARFARMRIEEIDKDRGVIGGSLGRMEF